jgi:hypothetical protein
MLTRNGEYLMRLLPVLLLISPAVNAQDLSLFGVNLRDDVSSYEVFNRRQHPYANGYFQYDVNVPLQNSLFETYVLSANGDSRNVEQVFAEASFGDFELCKKSADEIILSLQEKFGRGFEKFEGANGTSFEYAYDKFMANEMVSVVCSVEQGFSTFLWVDLRTYEIDDEMNNSSTNF